MSMDWRSLPAVITSSNTTAKPLEVKQEGIESSASTAANDDSEHYLIRDDPDQSERDMDVDEEDATLSSSESNEEDHEDEDDEEGLSAAELRRKMRRAKHLRKIKEVYADYLSSDGSGSSIYSSNSNHDDESHDTNLLQTVRYRPPRRTRGCPHWRIGCKFEGDEASLEAHIIHDCCFEKMKAMIKKRDHEISALQTSCTQLQHQVHQLHSLITSFMSLQTPQLQSYLISHLPNDVASNRETEGLSLNRNLSSELYDAPHNAINLSLHSLDDDNRRLAYQRREVNREMIHKHEMSIGGTLGLIWRSMETIIGYNDDINSADASLLNPTVNYINNDNVNRLTLNRNGLLTLPSYFEENNGNPLTQKNATKDIAVRALILFWNKVISTSSVGIQIWDILSDGEDRKCNEEKLNYNHSTLFGATRSHLHPRKANAKIQGLSHNGWLFNESSFGLATQPFSHPYWLFTGHKQQIRVWKYNGFSFNTTCNCNACCLMVPSQGYGDVRCIAVSSDHIFASSDSNIIQFWKFTESQQNTNLENENVDESSTHAMGASTLDKRINAVGHVEYLGNLVCGHRGMITSLKVFGDVLISGSKDGFITIWSATHLVNLSILHYGSNPVLDFTIFPNPYPLCHMTIWNEHLHALQTLHDKQTATAASRPNHDNANANANANANGNGGDQDLKSVIQYVSLNSLYDEIPKQEQNTIQDTILGFCGTDQECDAQLQDIDMLNNEDAPAVLESVFRAAIPSSTGSVQSVEDLENYVDEPQKQKQKENKLKASLNRNHNHNSNREVRVLSREIMHRASLHFASIALIIQDLKLIVGGRSGEIHIWHIGTTRDVFNSTSTWERETTLRGHGDIVTCLASFGTHLLSAYSNGSIKLWKWDKSDFLCTGTAYTDPVKRVGSADSTYCDNQDTDFNQSSHSCNSVRSVLLLPSPTLNLNQKLKIEDNRMSWSSFDEEDKFDEQDDDDDDNFSEFNVKISPNHDDKIRQRKSKKRKEHKHKHKNKMNNNEFWVLSGTSNGSMLLHEMDYL